MKFRAIFGVIFYISSVTKHTRHIAFFISLLPHQFALIDRNSLVLVVYALPHFENCGEFNISGTLLVLHIVTLSSKRNITNYNSLQVLITALCNKSLWYMHCHILKIVANLTLVAHY